MVNSCSDFLDIWSLPSGTFTVNGKVGLWASLDGVRETNWSSTTGTLSLELHIELGQGI